MGEFVVTVTFSIKAGHTVEFREAMLANAADSIALEPGCRLFDVCEAADGAEIFLYEIYDDRAAFDAHLATEHFRRFDRLVAPWVIDKRVATYVRLGVTTKSHKFAD
ncbi:putative quinol monooxygenase [Bradyrhizobium sp. SBR1B]|jgi:quinol monooxygenase YgiN|uniref:putative quinol monooxygenase n=1 Tax=Bradyrhizobium sp. SBR1B TaxID=2663836 RepID=UPI0016063FA6|nr:putative quinol monooxygenase [Bradyrhizobium sp. SBR1B]MBB4380406.1 quinol monooxygenase YgiN [Bradyrhizobium sp. SBR1B]